METKLFSKITMLTFSIKQCVCLFSNSVLVAFNRYNLPAALALSCMYFIFFVLEKKSSSNYTSFFQLLILSRCLIQILRHSIGLEASEGSSSPGVDIKSLAHLRINVHLCLLRDISSSNRIIAPANLFRAKPFLPNCDSVRLVHA